MDGTWKACKRSTLHADETDTRAPQNRGDDDDSRVSTPEPDGLLYMMRTQLLVLLTLCIAQVAIMATMLSGGKQDGMLMECMMPPCQRTYPLWMNILVFSGIGFSALLTLSTDRAPNSAFIYGTIAIALCAMAFDTHYMHPIPHAGKSLNPLMYSSVPIAQQQLLPFGSCILSVAIMGINMIAHRALSSSGKQKGA